MNAALIRFEAQRFVRPRVWLILVGLVGVTVSVFDRDHAMESIFFGTGMSFFFGIMISSRAQDGLLRDRAGTECQYLLSRAGTRSQILVSRWIFYAVVAVVLWSALMVALAARGNLSSPSEGRVGWKAVAALEANGHNPRFSPRARQQYARWVAEGQPSTRNSVNVELPWVAPTGLAFTFLAFLLGVVGQGLVGPPRTRRQGRRWLVAVLSAIAGGGFALLVAFPGRLAWISANLYLHLGVAVTLGLALIALLVSLSIRTWQHADF